MVSKLFSAILLAAVAVSIDVSTFGGHWDCTSYHIFATINQPIEPVVCTCTTWRPNPRFNPQLPVGLNYELVEGSNNFKTITISGTPAVAQQTKTYSIGQKEYVSQLRISIIGNPTSLSYGFDTMTQYVGVPIEPVPARSDVYLSTFAINPQLPSGVNFNTTDGTITGVFPDTATSNQVYTVTGSNNRGSVTTTLKFLIRNVNEMQQNGFIGCYWSGVTECMLPAFDYYYQNTAQYCQTETKFDFSDSYGEGDGNTWPGLDERFRDYYTSYFYGYFNVLAPATYTFTMNSDDGSILYIDSLDEPLINRDGCRGGSNTQDSIELAAGRHLFVVKFLEINGAATLSLKLAAPDVEIENTIIDNTMTKVGGRGPSFITYPLVTGYVNAELKVITPEMISGGASSWTVSPALPTGLYMDQYRGEIRGKPVATYDGYHTVTATGINGVASTQIHVIIANTLLSGFRGKYYKVVDTEMCMYTSLAPSQVELKVIKIDSQINFPTTLIGVWPGVPTDFTSWFYVEWEGYLHYEEIGNWGLRIGCSAVCRVFSIEETNQIDLWPTNGCHSYTVGEQTIAISSAGYYYYKIRYAINTLTTKGVVLEWRAPSGNWEVIPADKIFHIATDLLSYQVEQAHYFKNVAITDNTPSLFYVASCSNYQVVPTLPTGLSIDPNSGVISGTPVEEQDFVQYTVSCTAPTGSISTTILIDVFYQLPPSGLTLTYSSSTITESTLITLVPLTAMSQISVSGSYSLTTFTISPELPEGLSISPSTGAITGTPYQPMEEKTYSVVATNPGGMLVMTFRMLVSGCKGNDGSAWTNDFLFIDLITGSATFAVESNGATSQCASSFSTSDGNAVMSTCTKTLSVGGRMPICMKSDSNAKIRITCTDENGCKWQMRRPDGNRWPTKFTYDPVNFQPFIEVIDYPLSYTPLTSVTLSAYETTVYTGAPMDTITISPNGCYKSIEITPSLGVDFTLDLTNPVINTSVNGVVKSVYTITASGDAGTASVELTVFFRDCGLGGTSLLTTIVNTLVYGSEQSFSIYRQDDNLLIMSGSGYSSYSSYTQTQCVQPGNYIAKLYDSYGDGWSSGSYLKIYDGSGILIQEFTLSTGTEYTGYFTVAASESSSFQWKLLTSGKANKEWTNAGFDDSAWTTTGEDLEYGTWSQNTIYARYTFNLKDAIYYPLVQFSIWYKDGIIVYLNGNEVYRRNLASSSVTANTMASQQFDGYYLRVGSAPGYLLVDGDNVIAIEIHKHATTSGPIQFQGSVSPLQGECISRVDGGSITESSFFNQAYESAAAAWDRNTDTKWIENGLPAWTVYAYNFDRMEWVNRLALVSNPSYSDRDPTSFNLYGSTDGVNWDELFSYKSKAIFTARSERKEFMMMNHMNSYNEYKFEMLETVSGNAKVSVSVIDLMSCQLNYCVKDGGFDGVYSDETSVANCPSGYIGEMYRKCSLAALKPTWGEPDMTECLTTTPPKKTVYIDAAIYFVGLSVETVQMVSADAIRNTYAEVLNIAVSTASLWKVKDVTSEYEYDNVVSAVWIRLTLPEEDASTVLKKVVNIIPEWTSILRTYYGDRPEMKDMVEMNFYMNPVLQERGVSAVSVTLIVILVILIVIIGAIVAFYIWVRTKSKKSKDGAKQLRAAGAGRVAAQKLSGKGDINL